METEPRQPVPSSGRRPWRRRPGVLALGLLIVIELLYLVAANLFLSTGLADRVINRKPEKLLVSYDSAWSPWPGEVRVRGLLLRGQSRRQQWTASAERVSGRIGLVPLAWKRFRVAGVDGEGVLFRLRRRDDRPLPKAKTEGAREPPASAEEAEPPIPGLENPPDPAPEELYPPLDPDRRRWTVSLTGFDLTDVREVWIDRVRVAGPMELRDGGLVMRLKRSVAVPASRFELRGATVELDGEPIAEEVTGDLRLTAEPFDHAENRGWEALPHLLAEADLAAEIPDLQLLEPYLAPEGGLEIEGGGGRLTVDAALRGGRFASGSRVAFVTETLAVGFLDYTAEGAGELAWAADGESASLQATFARYRLGRRGHDRPHVVGRGLAATLSGLGPSLPPDLYGARLAIEIPPARVPDLSFYNAYLPPAAGLVVRSGEGRVRGRFRARPSEGTASGRLVLASDRVVAAFRGTPVAGALEIDARLPSGDLETRRFGLDGTRVTIRRARLLGGRGAAGRPWSGRVTLRDGVLSPGAPVLLRATAEGTVSDVRPVLSLFEAGERLPDWVLEALGIDDVRARVGIEVGGERTTLRRLAARADDLSLDGDLVLRGAGRRDGRLLLGYKRLHVGLEIAGGETDLKLLRARQWFEASR